MMSRVSCGLVVLAALAGVLRADEVDPDVVGGRPTLLFQERSTADTATPIVPGAVVEIDVSRGRRQSRPTSSASQSIIERTIAICTPLLFA